MGDATKNGRNVGIYIGIWTVILCMSAGLVFKMRLSVILERSAMSFAASLILGHILVSVIENLSSAKRQATDRSRTQKDTARSPKKDDQMVTETEE